MIEVEFTEEEYYLIHELLLRGLDAKEQPVPREYMHAFDEFVDYSPIGDRIWDQPENIREVWEEFLDSQSGGTNGD